jgi:hypothetical protein
MTRSFFLPRRRLPRAVLAASLPAAVAARFAHVSTVAFALAGLASGCSSSSHGGAANPGGPEAGTPEAGAGDGGPMATTTIAAARQALGSSSSGPSITVNAVVTAVQGPTGDQVIWYVEDPAGGPYSGVSVFCDPLAAKTCPCMSTCKPHVAAPPIGTLVSITGALSTYHAQVQLEPTAQTILQMGATPPPVYMAQSSDLAETGDSPYRGVYVKYANTVTVDDVTPSALYDSECDTDGGAGMPLCSGCEPPTYAGFEVNGPGANAFFVEETFFPFVPLASSPECLAQTGAVPVKKGQTFPFMAGILDVDPYSMRQALAPTGPSDY